MGAHAPGGERLAQAWENASLARFEAERVLADIAWRRGQFDKAEAHYEQALADAQTLGHVEGLAKTHNHLANLHSRRGDFDQARLHREKAIEYFRQTGNRLHLAGAQLNHAFDYNLAGQRLTATQAGRETATRLFQNAGAAAQEALAAFEQLGQPLGRAIAAQNMAEAYLYLGELGAAEQYAMRILQEQEQSVMPDGLRTLGEIKAAQGDYLAAEAWMHKSIQAAQAIKDPYLEGYAWRSLGQLLLGQGHANEGRAALEQAITLFEAQGLDQEVARTRADWKRLEANPS